MCVSVVRGVFGESARDAGYTGEERRTVALKPEAKVRKEESPRPLADTVSSREEPVGLASVTGPKRSGRGIRPSRFLLLIHQVYLEEGYTP